MTDAMDNFKDSGDVILTAKLINKSDEIRIGCHVPTLVEEHARDPLTPLNADNYEDGAVLLDHEVNDVHYLNINKSQAHSIRKEFKQEGQKVVASKRTYDWGEHGTWLVLHIH